MRNPSHTVGTSIPHQGLKGRRYPSTPVALSIPADADYLILVRSAVGHLGARIELSLSELDDLRLAVNEACSLFLVPEEGIGANGQLDCLFTLIPGTLGEPGVLQIAVSADVEPQAPPPFRRFGWALLEALVDDLAWEIRGGRATVRLAKRASGGVR